MPLAIAQNDVKGTKNGVKGAGRRAGGGGCLVAEKRGLVKSLCFLSPPKCVSVCVYMRYVSRQGEELSYF